MNETDRAEREEFRAYYFSLFATGCEPIDSILRWIAEAGRAYHSTSYWDDREDGPSYVDLIQEAADQAAAALAPTAAPAAESAESEESPAEWLQRLGMDGREWAREFRRTAVGLGYSDMDEGWLIGWFANAIMAGFDEGQRRALAAPAAPEASQPGEDAELVERVCRRCQLPEREHRPGYAAHRCAGWTPEV